MAMRSRHRHLMGLGPRAARSAMGASYTQCRETKTNGIEWDPSEIFLVLNKAAASDCSGTGRNEKPVLARFQHSETEAHFKFLSLRSWKINDTWPGRLL
ncbi:hypothetical protein WN943_012826 [Citrus x changshan-huyou]